MKILVVNGPNLNMLGLREPEIYGNKTYNDLENFIKSVCDGENIECEIYQSNHEGDIVEAGAPLTEGAINPGDILAVNGQQAVQNYIISEVQRAYRTQGVDINDKHIELIVRQMLQKIRVEENGESDLLPGSMVDALDFMELNEKLEEEGKALATGSQVLLGITKASLATNSFLSAASFQETTKVLTEAAIKGKVDPLIGMKENVIIGKLIPAGTGMKRYRNIEIDSKVPVAEAAMEDEVVTDEFDEDSVMATIEE